jgi:hypothetical protein
VYAGNTFDQLNLEAGSNQSAIVLKATLDHLKNGQTLNVYGISADGSIANNQIDLALNIKDKSSTDKYHLNLLVKQPTFGDYVFSIKPGNLLLNYDNWTVPSDNSITVNGYDLHISNLVLSKSGQQLVVNSSSSANNSPIDIGSHNSSLELLQDFSRRYTSCRWNVEWQCSSQECNAATRLHYQFDHFGFKCAKRYYWQCLHQG